MRPPAWLAAHLAALRALLVFTVLLGVAYPLTLVAVGRLPGLDAKTDGSLLTVDGRTVGSTLIGQSFTDADGDPVPRYFQSRPSGAGDGYDPTASGASNLGPESVLDALAVDPQDSTRSLLSQVCARSRAVGLLDGVDGRRPYCTPDGVGAVLAVFRADGLTGRIIRVVSVNQTAPATPFVTSWQGVPVELAQPGEDYRAAGGLITPVRGDAPAHPAVPADAVTAGGSGLDPHISPAYAGIQVARVARERGADPAVVRRLVAEHTTGRTLGFMGAPAVNVLALNLALDRSLPAR
ncbi:MULTISPECIES: potassium-transporting ATPase subunit C [unclassified Micromonospora]|uniref:potassium-transporting ATPase subunit C n=1 Tax=unclassified Micromonospora TaxID=2617518 RepID=UPI001C5DFBCD|nr:potassium-transporting ATPase subunit C [Micromonospora sp. RL09-050-HVF-A]MBW4704514.1 potassium-transporting ATPase subunit C [Micromonospora sp. RL09-050-HVF-A]